MEEMSPELEKRGNKGVRHFGEVRGVVPVLVHCHEPLVGFQCPHIISNHVMREVILWVHVQILYRYVVDSPLTMTSMAMNIQGESSLWSQ